MQHAENRKLGKKQIESSVSSQQNGHNPYCFAVVFDFNILYNIC